jgi:NADPH-dependent 7-cyano-7-deazaguanine reductase QueF
LMMYRKKLFSYKDHEDHKEKLFLVSLRFLRAFVASCEKKISNDLFSLI